MAYTHVRDIRDYAVAMDGATDDSAKIQQAIDATDAAGGGIIYFPAGTLAIASPLTITGHNVVLMGDGERRRGSAGDPTTTLLWTGATYASGDTTAYTMVKIAPTSGAGNPAATGCGIIGIHLDGNSKAARALDLRSHRGGQFRLSTRRCKGSSVYIGVVAALAEFRDPQDNVFESLYLDQSTASMGACLELDGDATANTSLNQFIFIVAVSNTEDALVIGNSDRNQFVLLNTASTSGYGVRLKGGASGTQMARYNIFHSSSATVYSEGTETAGVTNPAHSNVFYHFHKQGGIIDDPTIGTAGHLWWFPDTMQGQMMQGTAFP